MSKFAEKSTEWYESFEESLADADCEINAAEFQGILAGMISAGLNNNDKQWYNTILEVANQGNQLPEAASLQLRSLFEESQSAFKNEEMLAPILLPGDDYPLVDRLEALSLWCQGYLLGFGLQLGSQPADNKEVLESLQDISEISQLEVSSDDSEDSQAAFLTVVEHIKVAVKVIYLEMVFKKLAQPVSQASVNKTLH
jgi:uncharacterized protein